MRGRKPTPTALKLLRGNPGKRPIDDNEPQPEAGHLLAPPEYLNDAARDEWDRVAPELHKLGLLTELDWVIFECYCENYGRYVAAVKELGDLTTITVNKCVIQNPLVGIVNKAQDNMRKFAAELGMSPSARTRVSVDMTQQEHPTLEDILNAPGSSD